MRYSVQNRLGNLRVIQSNVWYFSCYSIFTLVHAHCLLKVYLSFLAIFFFLQKYRYQDEDAPHDHTLPRLTHEVRGPELVHVSEKNLSQIENVHGYVLQSHISPLKVGLIFTVALVLKYEKRCSMKRLGNLFCCTNRQALFERSLIVLWLIDLWWVFKAHCSVTGDGFIGRALCWDVTFLLESDLCLSKNDSWQLSFFFWCTLRKQ